MNIHSIILETFEIKVSGTVQVICNENRNKTKIKILIKLFIFDSQNFPTSLFSETTKNKITDLQNNVPISFSVFWAAVMKRNTLNYKLLRKQWRRNQLELKYLTKRNCMIYTIHLELSVASHVL